MSAVLKIALGVVLGLTVMIVGAAALIDTADEPKGTAGSATPVASAATQSAATDTATTTAPPAVEGVADTTVTVTESGFRNETDGLPASFGAALRNPSKGLDAMEVNVTVNALDAAGDVIATTDELVSVIPPGKTFYVGGDLDTGQSKVDSLDVQVDVGETGPAMYPLPKVSRVRVEQDEYGGTTVRAQVENTLNADLSSIADCFAVLRSADGKIVGGAKTFMLSDLRAGQRAALQFDLLSSVKSVTKANVSVDNEING